MDSRRYRKSQNFYEVARQVFAFAHVLSQPKRYAMIMAVMVPREPRETWTDERLDDLNKTVDDGFARLDADIRELRGEIKDLRSEMNARFDALNRNLLVGAVAIIAAIISSSAF
jgi:hypothetical protein